MFREDKQLAQCQTSTKWQNSGIQICHNQVKKKKTVDEVGNSAQNSFLSFLFQKLSPASQSSKPIPLLTSTWSPLPTPNIKQPIQFIPSLGNHKPLTSFLHSHLRLHNRQHLLASMGQQSMMSMKSKLFSVKQASLCEELTIFLQLRLSFAVTLISTKKQIKQKVTC